MGFGKWAMQPLTSKPSIYAKKLSDKIDNPQGEGGYGKGLLAGGVEGVGNILSEMTSPFSLATSAIGAPWLRGIKSLSSIGNIAHRIPSSSSGIGAGINIPELVARGGEDVYNAGRGIYNPVARSLDDVAYNTVRTGNDPVRKQIGGTFNLAEAIRRSNLR